VSSTGYQIPDTKYQKGEHRSYLVDRDAVWRHCSIIIFRSFVQLIPVQVVGCGRNRGSLYSPRVHHREVSTGTQMMFLLSAIVAARHHQADAEEIQFMSHPTHNHHCSMDRSLDCHIVEDLSAVNRIVRLLCSRQ
jgi:hypothetical protein